MKFIIIISSYSSSGFQLLQEFKIIGKETIPVGTEMSGIVTQGQILFGSKLYIKRPGKEVGVIHSQLSTLGRSKKDLHFRSPQRKFLPYPKGVEGLPSNFLHRGCMDIF